MWLLDRGIDFIFAVTLSYIFFSLPYIVHHAILTILSLWKVPGAPVERPQGLPPRPIVVSLDVTTKARVSITCVDASLQPIEVILTAFNGSSKLFQAPNTAVKCKSLSYEYFLGFVIVLYLDLYYLILFASPLIIDLLPHWLHSVSEIYCTALYCTVLYCTVLYCTVLYCTVLYLSYLPCLLPSATIVPLLSPALHLLFLCVKRYCAVHSFQIDLLFTTFCNFEAWQYFWLYYCKFYSESSGWIRCQNKYVPHRTYEPERFICFCGRCESSNWNSGIRSSVREEEWDRWHPQPRVPCRVFNFFFAILYSFLMFLA